MNATRKSEIIKAMPSFSKERYPKSELLPELFKLQSELVDLTFNGDHAENAQLKIWDVYNHLAKLNEVNGHVADDMLEKFWCGCKTVNESIRGEISGNRGEYKAFRSLETVHTAKIVLQNIELCSGDHRTELDLIVFTEKAVFILEVKNPTMDVVIDERGNYCRVRDGKLSFDKNVGERMNDKDFLLRQVLQAAGIENPNIVNLMVFTNNNIQVTNKFPYIQHCFLSSLPHLVDCYEGEVLYSQATISKMVEATEAAKCPESYPLPLDIVEFKQDFANLMVALEGASEEPEGEEPAQPEHPVAVAVGIPFWRKIAKVTATVIPVFGVAVLAAFGMSKAVKG